MIEQLDCIHRSRNIIETIAVQHVAVQEAGTRQHIAQHAGDTRSL